MQILDHGYLKLIEHWGSDERIIEAARMSTDKGFQGWGQETCQWCDKTKAEHISVRTSVDVHFGARIQIINPTGSEWALSCGGGTTSQFWTPSVPVPGDEKLLAYLYANKHATPFEMAGMVIEVQAPIFVFREWHRHRTQSYNELSARYTPLPDLNYVPTVERLMLASKSNKQAGTIKDADVLTESNVAWYLERLQKLYAEQEAFYKVALMSGVPKELARIHLPVGRYSRMRASANLRNWLAFLTLRMDEKAQWEIRQYANAVGSVISNLFPRTWSLFDGARAK